MNMKSMRSHAIVSTYLLGAAAIAACNGGNGSNGSFPGGCFVGQPVVVPSADATDPTVSLSFFLPDGTTVSAPAGSGPTDVVTPPGEVVISAVADDPEGIRDVQLWVASRQCTFDPSLGDRHLQPVRACSARRRLRTRIPMRPGATAAPGGW